MASAGRLLPLLRQADAKTNLGFTMGSECFGQTRNGRGFYWDNFVYNRQMGSFEEWLDRWRMFWSACCGEGKLRLFSGNCDTGCTLNEG